jgi:hypothetical protein
VSKKYAGADWLKPVLQRRGVQISEFGKKVADLLGDFQYGIYHIETSALIHKRTDWTDSKHIEIVLHGVLTTYDGHGLTRLVLLCHDRSIRCELRGISNGYIKFSFSPRHPRSTGRGFSDVHPTIEQAIEDWRSSFPLPQMEESKS